NFLPEHKDPVFKPFLFKYRRAFEEERQVQPVFVSGYEFTCPYRFLVTEEFFDVTNIQVLWCRERVHVFSLHLLQSITESFCKHIVHVRNRSRWVCDNDRVIHAVKSCSEYREPVPFCYELIVSCLQLHLRSFEESNICAEYRNGLHRTMGIQDRDDRIIIH